MPFRGGGTRFICQSKRILIHLNINSGNANLKNYTGVALSGSQNCIKVYYNSKEVLNLTPVRLKCALKCSPFFLDVNSVSETAAMLF